MLNSKNIKKAIAELSSRGVSDKEISSSVISFLSKHHMQSMLPRVLSLLDHDNAKEKKDSTLKIKVSANSEVSTKTIDAIKVRMDAMKAETEIEEDPFLGAGFLAEYRGMVLDGSASNQLKKMKETFNRK